MSRATAWRGVVPAARTRSAQGEGERFSRDRSDLDCGLALAQVSLDAPAGTMLFSSETG